MCSIESLRTDENVRSLDTYKFLLLFVLAKDILSCNSIYLSFILVVSVLGSYSVTIS